MPSLVRRILVEASARLRSPSLFRVRVYGDRRRLKVDRTAVLNNATINLSSGTVKVERLAFFGHNVTLLTGNHDITKFGIDRHRAVPATGRDIVIEEGAWVTTNATVIGPCRVGAHSVVAVGAVVMSDVPPFSVVAGVPAQVVRKIEHTDLD